MTSVLKFEEARVKGVEYAIKVYESHPEPFRGRYAVGIPKEAFSYQMGVRTVFI